MSRTKTDSRTRLLRAADTLTFQRGFRRTTLADIAKEAGVPLGNVYYYFRTKDQLGEAIIHERVARFEAERKAWDRSSSPKERLCASADSFSGRKAIHAEYGCPLGTLSTDLRKEGGALAKAAPALFSNYLDWIEAQFLAMGKKKESRALALHFLSVLEGSSVIANSFNDPGLVDPETDWLKKWVRAL